MIKASAIILAGGKSSRMGQDKGLLVFNGRKMIEYVLERVQSVCTDIMVLSNNSSYSDLGCPVKQDLVENAGPIGGVYSGLTYSKNELNLILTCDMPFISSALMIKMLEGINDDADLLYLANSSYNFLLTAVYRKSVAPKLKQRISDSEFRMQDLSDVIASQRIELSKEQEYELFNVNTPADLLELERIKSKTTF